jgi:hypothetical protein
MAVTDIWVFLLVLKSRYFTQNEPNQKVSFTHNMGVRDDDGA